MDGSKKKNLMGEPSARCTSQLQPSSACPAAALSGAMGKMISKWVRVWTLDRVIGRGQTLFFSFFFSSFFGGWGGCVCGMWKFPDQEVKPHHSSDPQPWQRQCGTLNLLHRQGAPSRPFSSMLAVPCPTAKYPGLLEIYLKVVSHTSTRVIAPGFLNLGIFL